MKNATLVLVRPDPRRSDANHPADVQAAKIAAGSPPCWVLLVGKGREKRRDAMRRELGLEGIAKDGLSVFAPAEVAGESDPDALARELAQYLADVGLRMPLRQATTLEVQLPEDLDPALLAAVMEAVAIYPRTDVRVGERTIQSSLRWELRRDHFRSPLPDDRGSDLNGSSPAVERVRQQIARYADKPFPVLVLGETGTGKEVVATMLHEQSARQGRFMAQNAAQLPPELADSLLFGHGKGAFTGADTDRPGRIREAEGGTFFLDEVFNLHPTVQGKLLRALNRVDEGVILVEPVSAGSPRPPAVVHARLVVSALDDPRTAPTVNGGSSMRTDLYYRVAAGVIRLPPLRECLDDLPLLCRRLLGRLEEGVVVEDDGIAVLRGHSWPGNVRELRLVLLRALMDGPRGAQVLTADVLEAALESSELRSAAAHALPLPCNLERLLKRMEVQTMRAALLAADGVKAEAGRKIGMDPKNVRNFGTRLETAERKLRKLDGRDAK